MNLKNKVCLVTGGARGLGQGCAEAMLKRGAKVYILDILEDLGKETVTTLRAEYGDERVFFIRADVTSQEQMTAAFDQVVRESGGLDVVMNNAGIDEYVGREKVFAINMFGVMRGTDLAVERMRKDKGGRGGVIVNVASICGIYCLGSLTNYTGSKHAVVGYTRSLGLECGDEYGIKFRVLCPASMPTEQFRAWQRATGKTEGGGAFKGDMKPENAVITTVAKVVETCMTCIERDDLPQGAVVKGLDSGMYQAFPEQMPCQKL